MKKILFLLLPFLVAFLTFFLFIFYLNINKDKGALQITTVPSAKVYINGKLVGQTPLCKCQPKDMLIEGVYTIKLVPIQGDFAPFEQKITISPKVLTVIDRNFASLGLENGSIISLKQITDKKDAQISVISFPENAQIFLDNNLQGQTPLLLKNISESDHELKLTKEGYKDKIVRVRTALGYKLEALIFMGVNPDLASSSATLISSSPAVLSSAKVLILKTPTGFLRVRADASIGSLEVAQVKPDEVYPLLDEQNGWYKIKLSDGKEGWVSSQYAKKQS